MVKSNNKNFSRQRGQYQDHQQQSSQYQGRHQQQQSPQGQSRNERRLPGSYSTKSDNSQSNQYCNKCGQQHRYQCPALGKICKNCEKLNHFAKYCKTKYVKNLEFDNSDREQFVCIIDSSNKNNVKTDWLVDLSINNYVIQCLIDTGAQTNCMSFDQFEKLGLNRDIIQPNQNKLLSYCGTPISNLGSCILNCKINNQSTQI